ncbi:MAG TPA: D-aminoacyl-tRNA deacylase [Dehalococcoidia bacterium]|nr:D-aminoacyl-tRNA deacylase [Dehalococcoidia bacterium]
MRLVVQRVSQASVSIDGERIAAIGRGLLILAGAAQGDTADDARKLARKAAELRIFADENGKFNRSLLEVKGEALVVSQFTLLGDTRKGRRPNFMEAAPPEVAEPLVEELAQALREAGVATQTGRFGAMMEVALVNDGPVTLILDSRKDQG